ncbi:ATP-dependent endonuclease [Leptospira koniambonensis]|uniref:ATP-dependent endonuclease n=1 Tax=Leptospira koniambonensis TaxID=2484950 RepID=A0A4R9J1Y6_9LEPT|nr:ATP-dependent endonuclease [Leptospira koniambonensis]TGL28298.1 ATP-dependent endonuclease [Leptospira koniambonensis]
MKIKKARIKNFRLLKDVSLTLDNKITLIVGRNNTGKTSLAEIFRSFLNPNGSKVRYEDFNQSCLTGFEEALKAFKLDSKEGDIRTLIPTIELELVIDYKDDENEYGVLGDFIIDLDDKLFETNILVSYQLKDGKIKEFFQELDIEDRKKYFSDLKNLINQHFESVVYAVEPTNRTNKARLDFATFKRLILSGLINAQRGLDDETHNERDVLGKALGNIFKSSNNAGAPEEFKARSEEIKIVVSELQEKVDTDFQEKVMGLLPTLNLFGYPGLQDPNLSAATDLNLKSLLESNTRVFYKGDDFFHLPETYNGLGVRNLIFILFRIYEYFREFQSQTTPPKGHLIFIEEPEAHLHPQMQEVFIRQLEEIVSKFQEQLNDGKLWPVQFVVSTHSSHIANEADFSKIRYFLSKFGKETTVKDLGEAFNCEELKADREFLHKYLTLTKCDLYFADKAILIEGPTERIIMPEIIKKVDKTRQCNLRKKYLSIVEVGGAYAHHFYKFIDFLELKTLFITDLDSVKKTTGKKPTTYSASYVSEGTHSSNVGLSNWFGKEGYIDLTEIRSHNDESKVSGCRRLAFQVDEDERGLCGRSFEDAFILANTTLFTLENLAGIELENAIFEKAKAIGKESKANFAIEYSIKNTEWAVPKYIREGLEWLDKDEATHP